MHIQGSFKIATAAKYRLLIDTYVYKVTKSTKSDCFGFNADLIVAVVHNSSHIFRANSSLTNIVYYVAI